MVERTEDAFAVSDDSAVEDVRRILNDVRTQYDQVHKEAEHKEAELCRLREAIRVAETSGASGRLEDSSKSDDVLQSLVKQTEATEKAVFEAQTSQKVYQHMLSRISKEQAILK